MPLSTRVSCPFIIGRQVVIVQLFLWTSNFLQRKLSLPLYLHGSLDTVLFYITILQYESLIPRNVGSSFTKVFGYIGTTTLIVMECVLLHSLVLKCYRLVTKCVVYYARDSKVVQIVLILVAPFLLQILLDYFLLPITSIAVVHCISRWWRNKRRQSILWMQYFAMDYRTNVITCTVCCFSSVLENVCKNSMTRILLGQ